MYVTKVANAPVQQVVGSTFQFTIQAGVIGLADAMVEDAVLSDTLPTGLVLDSLTEDPFENGKWDEDGLSNLFAVCLWLERVHQYYLIYVIAAVLQHQLRT